MQVLKIWIGIYPILNRLILKWLSLLSKTYSRHIFLCQILRYFCFNHFFIKPLLKSAFSSLKWGFLFLIWKLISTMIFLFWNAIFRIISALLPQFPRYYRNFRDLKIGFPAFEIALFHFRNAEKKLLKKDNPFKNYINYRSPS